VRQLQFTAVRAFLKLGCGQRMVAATHVAAGRRGLALGNGHEAPVSIIETGNFPPTDAHLPVFVAAIESGRNKPASKDE
jgi:hypothetical protein